MVGRDSKGVALIQFMNGTGVNSLGHRQGILLAERTPIIGIAEFQNGDQIQKIGRGLGKLDGLVTVASLDHAFALLKAKVCGMACSGVIPGKFRREI
jgi:hypothetical protein